MPRTFVICKPDAVERGLVGEIIARIECKGLTLSRAELRTIDRDTAAVHYEEHDGKPFFEDLIDFTTRSPAMLMVVEGPDDAGDDIYAVVRNLMGATNPANAAEGTIRKAHALSIGENSVHGSDAPETAAQEIKYWFSDIEIVG